MKNRILYPHPLSFNNKITVLLPPSQNRLYAVGDVLGGKPRAEQYLFYGLDYFIKRGVPCIHNLQPRPNSRVVDIIAFLHRNIFSRFFIHYGEIEWVLPVWKHLYRTPLLFVFSERIMLAIIYWRILGILPRQPTVLIPIGLPEKLKDMQKKRPRLFRLCLRELRKIDRIVTLSNQVEKVLKKEYRLEHNVCFIPAGVDHEYFRPTDASAIAKVDVLSVGADIFRDFQTLFQAAFSLPDCSFRVITRKIIADSFNSIPSNMEVITDIPMERIRDFLAASTLLALPVHDNTYSGATTVLLQAMAMGKPVVANRVGANVGGYGFRHGKNIIFVQPRNSDALIKEISTLMQNPALCESIGNQARETVVQKLGLNRFNNELYELLDKVFVQAWCKHLT